MNAKENHQAADMALSSMSQEQVIKALGAVGLSWAQLWKIEEVQDIYNCLLIYDPRLQGSTRGLWKPDSYILPHLKDPPKCFDSPEDEGPHEPLLIPPEHKLTRNF
jgi:hypothetical protein